MADRHRPQALFDDAVPTSDGPECVRYVPGWCRDDDVVLAELARAVEWEQPSVTVYGRQHPTPRLTAWFGDAAYSYSGITHQPRRWPPALAALRDALAAEIDQTFNSCLGNLYRDGSDSMGEHSDNELELGREPVIASVSLGDRRRFVLRHIESKRRFEWWLGRGDLLVMSGDSQESYRHSVPKTTRLVEPRLNLTFRSFHTPATTRPSRGRAVDRPNPGSGKASG